MSRSSRRLATEAIVALVRARTGLSLPESQWQHTLAGVQRAMQMLRVDDVGQLSALVQRDAAAMDVLLAELTVGETYFFREPAQWEFLRDTLIPELAAREPTTRPIRAWSAACATGEEAYSLAIVLDQLGLRERGRVLGTDLSRARLSVARRGRYRAWSMRGIPPAVLGRYFKRAGDNFEVAPGVRSAVEFRYHNLADPSTAWPTPPGGFDLILCRNVLIYFDAETIARVAERLIGALSQDGWLFVAASDPFLARVVDCETVVVPSGVAYRRRRAAGGSTEPAHGVPRNALPGAARVVARTARRPPRVEGPAPPPAQPSAPAPSEARPEGLEALRRLYAAKDYTEVAERAAEINARSAGGVEAWVLRVRALANQGRMYEAGAACSAALEQHPTVPELVYLHAVLLSEGGYPAQATVALKRALYLDPGLAVGHLLLGALSLRQDDVAGARRAFHAAERLLLRLPADQPVPASDGESAGRLLQAARAQLALLDRETTR